MASQIIRITNPRLAMLAVNDAGASNWVDTVSLSTLFSGIIASSDSALVFRAGDGFAQFFQNSTDLFAYDKTKRSTKPLAFGIGGQSDADGHGLLTDLPGSGYPAAPKQCINFANDYRFKTPAVDPIDDNTNQLDGVSIDATEAPDGHAQVPGVCFGLPFADRITDPAHGNRSNQVILIPCPLGGTSSAQWQPGSNTSLVTGFSHFDRTTLYGSMAWRCALVSMKIGCALAGLLWYQGQSDVANSVPASTYQTNTQNIFNTLRSDLTSITGFDHSQMPIFIVELPATVITGYDATLWAQTQAAQAALAQSSPPQFVSQSPDGPYCDLAGSNFHLATGGHITLGHQLADLYLANY